MLLAEDWWASGLCSEVRRGACCVGYFAVHLSLLDIFYICPLLCPPLVFLPWSCFFYLVNSFLYFCPIFPFLPHQHLFSPSSASLVSPASPSSLLWFHSQSHSSPLLYYCSPCILLPWSSLVSNIFLQGLVYLLTADSSSAVPLAAGVAAQISYQAAACAPPVSWCVGVLLPRVVLLTKSYFIFFLLLFLEWVSCPLPQKKSAFSAGTELSRKKNGGEWVGGNFFLCFSARDVSNVYHVIALKVL